MSMTSLERLAALAQAVTLQGKTRQEAAQELGISYNHLHLVLLGERKGSARLEEEVAKFCGVSHEEMFGPRLPRSGGSQNKARGFGSESF